MARIRRHRRDSVQSPLETYLREINEVALLTADDEKMLAHRLAQGDNAARERMVRANLRLVVNIARGYVGKGLALQDLIEEGNLGLLRAVEGFDPAVSLALTIIIRTRSQFDAGAGPDAEGRSIWGAYADLGRNRTSRPERYKTRPISTNGTRLSASLESPAYIGLCAVIQRSIRSETSPNLVAMKAITMPEMAPPAM